MQDNITVQAIDGYTAHLAKEERSRGTIEKYRRDLRRFARFLSGGALKKEMVLEYKAQLVRQYAAASVNSMLAAVNGFLRYAGRPDCCVRQLKIQRQAFCPADKELTRDEYARLVRTAQKQGDRRLCLVLQTICGTGIRVSELRYITAEAATGRGRRHL